MTEDTTTKLTKAKSRSSLRSQGASKEAIDQLRASLLEPVTVHRIRRPKGSKSGQET